MEAEVTAEDPAYIDGEYNWQKISGPGNVLFVPNNNIPNPAFIADKPGKYNLKIMFKSKNKPFGIEFNDIKITVLPK